MPKPSSKSGEPFTVWHGLLLAESAAVLVGLLMPITPSRTGTGRSLAELFFTDPGYLLEAAVYFAMTNLLLAVIAVIAWLGLRRGGSRRGG